jgi:hypothetical protein
MARYVTTAIQGSECIGDSLVKINTNFENLDTRVEDLDTLVNTSSAFNDSTDFLATGTTEPRNLVTRFADVVNVKDFGAVGDGVADDTAAIQAAITFITNANKKGGKIEFPVGTYKITSTITLNYPMIFEGIGNSCVIAPNFASGDAFVLTSAVDLNRDDGVQFFNVHFKTSVVKTSGYYININGASYTSIKQCKFFNGYDGIGITGTASANTRIKDCHFANNTNFNIDITAVNSTGQGSVDIVLEDLWIIGQSDSIQSAAGVRVTSVGDLTLRHVSTVYCHNGLALVPPGGINRIQAMFVTESFFDSGSGYGIYAQGKIDLLSINQTWACTNKEGGILLYGIDASNTIREVNLIDVVASNNQATIGAGTGLLFGEFASGISVIGGSFSNNAGSGISVFAGATNFKIIGATCGTSGEFPGNQQYGIYVATGSSDGYTIANNRIIGNIAGQLFDGGTGLTKTIYPNIGVGTAITPNAFPDIDWGVDFAKRGATLIGSTPYELSVGSGLVLLHHNAGELAMFLAFAGTVTKVSGAASIVSGAAGLNQIGLSYNSTLGKYEVSCGYPTPQDVYVSTIKTRTAS